MSYQDNRHPFENKRLPTYYGNLQEGEERRGENAARWLFANINSNVRWVFGITFVRFIKKYGIDKLITQPWPIRPQIAFHAVAQFQDENARDRKNL